MPVASWFGLGSRLLGLYAFGCLLAPQAWGGLKSFESIEYGYAVKYPDDWHPQILSGIFYIESFPPSSAVRGARIPKGGAGISISVPPQLMPGQGRMPQSMDAWVSIGTARRHVWGKRAFDLKGSPGLISVIEVKTQCCSVPPVQETIQWYFQIDGHFFLAEVAYWQGDPSAGRFTDTLRTIVLSLRLSHR